MRRPVRAPNCGCAAQCAGQAPCRRRSAAGDGRDELRRCRSPAGRCRWPAGMSPCRGATVLDRVEHERRVAGDARGQVEVGPDVRPRRRGGERVAGRAGAREQLAAGRLVAVSVMPAGPWLRGLSWPLATDDGDRHREPECEDDEIQPSQRFASCASESAARAHSPGRRRARRGRPRPRPPSRTPARSRARPQHIRWARARLARQRAARADQRRVAANGKGPDRQRGLFRSGPVSRILS